MLIMFAMYQIDSNSLLSPWRYIVICSASPRGHQPFLTRMFSSSLSVRYKVAYKKDTGECRLEISMTFADDAGEYSVFAKNQLGEVSASTSLLEEGTSRQLSPTLLAVTIREVTSLCCPHRGI